MRVVNVLGSERPVRRGPEPMGLRGEYGGWHRLRAHPSAPLGSERAVGDCRPDAIVDQPADEPVALAAGCSPGILRPGDVGDAELAARDRAAERGFVVDEGVDQAAPGPRRSSRRRRRPTTRRTRPAGRTERLGQPHVGRGDDRPHARSTEIVERADRRARQDQHGLVERRVGPRVVKHRPALLGDGRAAPDRVDLAHLQRGSEAIPAALETPRRARARHARQPAALQLAPARRAHRWRWSRTAASRPYRRSTG